MTSSQPPDPAPRRDDVDLPTSDDEQALDAAWASITPAELAEAERELRDFHPEHFPAQRGEEP